MSLLAGAGGDTTTMWGDPAAAVAAFPQAAERWGLATALTYLPVADGMVDDRETAASALDEAITPPRATYAEASIAPGRPTGFLAGLGRLDGYCTSV